MTDNEGFVIKKEWLYFIGGLCATYFATSVFNSLRSGRSKRLDSKDMTSLKEKLDIIEKVQKESRFNFSSKKSSELFSYNHDSNGNMDMSSSEFIRSNMNLERGDSFRNGPYNHSYQMYRICLTGGPCAGKTTALAQISQKLTELGFRVFIVPEAATLMAKGGGLIIPENNTLLQAVKLQINIMDMQMALEDIFTEIAKSVKSNTVILCDRGVMDGSAYIKQEIWQALLDETGWSTVQLRDRRYEAVIHLVTAADGAEEFYNLEGNKARFEAPEQAREVDRKLIEAWVGHPHFSVVDNSVPGFEEKMKRCLDHILQIIGMPTATSFYKKFLVRGFDELLKLETLKKEVFAVEETYIGKQNPHVENKIRRRGQHDAFTYVHHARFYDPKDKKVRNDKKRQITAREFVTMMDLKCKDKKTVIKKRVCFMWDRQYFVIDRFENVDKSPYLLRIVVSRGTEKIQMPPFIEVLREVTDEHEYSSVNMASIDWKVPERDLKFFT